MQTLNQEGNETIMYIQITNRCNMSCDHCGFDCTAIGEDMPIAIFKAACEFAEENYESITIGGGEPTLHPNFWEFIGISLAHSTENIPFLVTNGSRTEIALRLAKLAQKGVIGCALSQDIYHDPIEYEVIEAFKKDRNNRRQTYDNDAREIRDVTGTEISAGRAKNWGRSGCVCDDIIVTPNGKLWACGCMTHQLGTIFKPELPEDREVLYGDYNCPNEYQKSLQNAAV